MTTTITSSANGTSAFNFGHANRCNLRSVLTILAPPNLGQSPRQQPGNQGLSLLRALQCQVAIGLCAIVAQAADTRIQSIPAGLADQALQAGGTSHQTAVALYEQTPGSLARPEHPQGADQFGQMPSIKQVAEQGKREPNYDIANELHELVSILKLGVGFMIGSVLGWVVSPLYFAWKDARSNRKRKQGAMGAKSIPERSL